MTLNTLLSKRPYHEQAVVTALNNPEFKVIFSAGSIGFRKAIKNAVVVYYTHEDGCNKDGVIKVIVEEV